MEQAPPMPRTFPIAPHASAADPGTVFKFDNPSPDDCVLAAQSGKATGPGLQSTGFSQKG